MATTPRSPLHEEKQQLESKEAGDAGDSGAAAAGGGGVVVGSDGRVYAQSTSRTHRMLLKPKLKAYDRRGGHGGHGGGGGGGGSIDQSPPAAPPPVGSPAAVAGMSRSQPLPRMTPRRP